MGNTYSMDRAASHTAVPLVSIITAVDPSRVDYFQQTIASVMEARKHSPDFEWIVQVDGESAECAHDALAASAKIQANRIHCGPGATRNFALERVTAMYVRNLDADDILMPQALVDIEAFLYQYHFPVWLVSAVYDTEDGTTQIERSDFIHGPVIQAGELLRMWDDMLIPVHPTTLCIQSDVARVFGGWMALPASEDTGLLMTVSSLFDGGYLSAPTVLYRRSPIQMSATEGWGKPGQTLEIRYALIRRRAELVAKILAPIERRTI